MAKPQKEDGYTPIANDLMEALYKSNLSGHEFRIALLVLRKTYGFHKKEDIISLSQMIAGTCLSKTRCSQIVNNLQLRKIVTVTENCNGIHKKYMFNKDFDTWQTVTENCNRYRKMKSTVTLSRNEPLRKTVTTKDTITKDTITKGTAHEIVLPDAVKKEIWVAYLEMRKTIKKPATPYAQKLIIKKLAKLGGDPNRLLEQSIENSWQDIYSLKTEGGNGNGRKTYSTNQRDTGLAAVQARADEEVAAIVAEYERNKAIKKTTSHPSTGDTRPDYE